MGGLMQALAYPAGQLVSKDTAVPRLSAGAAGGGQRNMYAAAAGGMRVGSGASGNGVRKVGYLGRPAEIAGTGERDGISGRRQRKRALGGRRTAKVRCGGRIDRGTTKRDTAMGGI